MKTAEARVDAKDRKNTVVQQLRETAGNEWRERKDEAYKTAFEAITTKYASTLLAGRQVEERYREGARKREEAIAARIIPLLNAIAEEMKKEN